MLRPGEEVTPSEAHSYPEEATASLATVCPLHEFGSHPAEASGPCSVQLEELWAKMHVLTSV